MKKTFIASYCPEGESEVRKFPKGCPEDYEKEVSPEVIRAFCVELLEFVQVAETHKKFLDKEAIIRELEALTQKFIRDIRAAPNDLRCHVMYSEYSEPVYELLAFGGLGPYSVHSKIKHKINDFRGEHKIALITDRFGVYP